LKSGDILCDLCIKMSSGEQCNYSTMKKEESGDRATIASIMKLMFT
jgi:hypothetical protein